MKRDNYRNALYTLISIGIILLISMISLRIMEKKIEKEQPSTTTTADTIPAVVDTIIPLNVHTLWDEINSQEIIHPEIVWAQAILESGWLKKHTNNNLFGMQKPKVRASFALKTSADNYAHFNTWQESVKDYKLWQQFNGLTTKKQTGELLSQEEYLDYLAYTYSQDPKYTQKLISIMNGNQELLTLK